MYRTLIYHIVKGAAPPTVDVVQDRNTYVKQKSLKKKESSEGKMLYATWGLKRISERSAAKVESHRLFKGEADGRKVRDTWTHLNAGERCAQTLAVPEDIKTHGMTIGSVG